MKTHLPTTGCNPERLESFLSGGLTDADERSFTLHLNSCESCRHSLAEQAAEPEVWREAEVLLKPSQFDPQNDDHNRDPALEMRPTRRPPQIQNVLNTLGPTDDPEMLGRLGSYEVLGVVGGGGMGVVLKAIDKSLDRTVAIKVMAPHLASNGAARKRFAREAKAAAAVLHPNVIAIHSVSNNESLPYLVMPFVRGTSLERRLGREGPLPLQEVLRIGAQIAAGLTAAHAQGLVHRDIKPGNILLEEGVERVTITDFGLARAVDDATITHSGMIAGTPQYMSPEQARGEPVDPRSDLFSLGSVLYSICTGRPPFRAETSYGVMRRITDDEPTPIREINPDVPEWLCTVIDKLMSKRAADRFESAAEVAVLLEACLAHVQQPTVAKLPPSLRPQAKSGLIFISRRWSGVIAMIAAFAFGLLGIFAWLATDAPDIAGKWSGPDWGEVALEKKQPGEYAGTYTDTFKEKPGTIEVKWSRFERRYKGIWREGQDRSGRISLRLVDDEIRGAWTTSKKSEINPGTPELSDLTWRRSQPTVAAPVDELADEPKGIRRRYKTVKAAAAEPPAERRSKLQGTVTDVKDQELVELSLGFDDGLQAGDTLILSRDKTYLGKITVLRVAADKSVARIESRKGDIRRGDLVAAEPKEQVEPTVGSTPPMSEQEAAVAKLVLVYFDDKSRRAVPCLVLNAGDTTFVITAGPATVVPDGTEHAVDRTFLELARGQPIPVEYDSRSTTEFLVFSAKDKFDAIQLKETVAVTEGDSVTAVSTSHVAPTRASVVGLGRRTKFELPDHKIHRVYEDLIEVDQTFPEGTPLFKNGKLVGVTLLGIRYVGESAKKSYVVPAARIVELCARLAQETAADPMKDTPPAPPRHLRQFPINHRVGAIACSPDGELIAIANSDVTFPLPADWKPAVEILDAKTGKSVVSLALATDEQRAALIATERLPHFEVGPLVFSPDGTVLAVSAGLGQVKLFNARSGELIRSLDDETARLADNATPEKLKALPRAMGRVASLAFSPDGSLLAACGSSFADVGDDWDRIERGRLGRSSTGPGRLKVWDVKTGTLKHDLAGHSHAFGVAYSPDGRWLASAGRWSTASNDGNGVLLWDLEKGAIHRTILIEANGGTHAVAFSPNKKLAAIGSIVFDKENDTRSTAVRAAYPLSGITHWQQTIQGAAMPRAFLPDGKAFVVLCSRKSIRFVDAETGRTKHEIETADSPKAEFWIDLALAPEAGIMVVAGAAQDTRGSVEIWQLPDMGIVTDASH